MKAFVVAMECEADAVISNMADCAASTVFGRKVVRGAIDGVDTAVVVAGVGKVNAAAGAQLALSSLGADVLLNVGVAGGLVPGMKVGEVYRIDRAVQFDFDLSRINGTPIGTPNECSGPFFALPKAGPWPDAVVATGDSFTDDEGEVEFLRRTFDANVREMELGAIAHVAARAGVPLYAWKAISDVAGLGTMFGQYAENLKRCLDILAGEIKAMFRAA